MVVNCESIYASQRVPSNWGGGILGMTTGRSNTVYLHIFRWPGKTATIPGVKNKVFSAKILVSGQPVRIEQADNGRLLLKGLPEKPPDQRDTVIVLNLDGKPEVFSYEGIPL